MTRADDAERLRIATASPVNQVGHVAHAILQSNRLAGTSTASLPPASLPQRKSSRSRLQRKSSQLSRASFERPALPPPPPRGVGHTVTGRGQSTSPVRTAARRYDSVSSDLQRVPSRTFVRSVRPLDILDVPELHHSRAHLHMQVAGPLFMSGGTIEGHITLTVDSGSSTKKRRSRPVMSIGRLSVDVLGVESADGRRWIFRSLASELIDEVNPPPSTMVAGPRKGSDAFWEVMPSSSVLPFRLNLPINMGPPPYASKHASIKYILCATLVLRISGKAHFVRSSSEIAVMTVHDRACVPRGVFDPVP